MERTVTTSTATTKAIFAAIAALAATAVNTTTSNATAANAAANQAALDAEKFYLFCDDTTINVEKIRLSIKDRLKPGYEFGHNYDNRKDHGVSVHTIMNIYRLGISHQSVETDEARSSLSIVYNDEGAPVSFNYRVVKHGNLTLVEKGYVEGGKYILLQKSIYDDGCSTYLKRYVDGKLDKCISKDAFSGFDK